MEENEIKYEDLGDLKYPMLLKRFSVPTDFYEWVWMDNEILNRIMHLLKNCGPSGFSDEGWHDLVQLMQAKDENEELCDELFEREFGERLKERKSALDEVLGVAYNEGRKLINP